MDKPRIFVTRRRIPEAIESLERHFEVDVWEQSSPPPKDIVIEKVQTCQGMFTEADDRIDEEIMNTATTLKVIANRAVGMDNIDVAAATKNGIVVSNTPGVLHESCADFTFGLMLSVARNITYGDRQIRAGEWKVFDQMPYQGFDVFGSTLGIVGLGTIGTAVARRASGFDMRVIYHSRTRKPEAEQELGVEWMPDLNSLLAESDYVSLHMPLSPDTVNYIGEKELNAMKSDAFLINTTRGRTVDPKALYNALSSNQIRGAAIDVTDPEPIPIDDPLLSLDNLLITPHISSASFATVRKMGLLATDNIIAHLTGGTMPSPVNPEVLS